MISVLTLENHERVVVGKAPLAEEIETKNVSMHPELVCLLAVCLFAILLTENSRVSYSSAMLFSSVDFP